MRLAATMIAAIWTFGAFAVQMASQPWVENRIAAATNALPAAATDLTPATNYTDAVAATLRAKSDLAYRNAAHNGIEKWVVTIHGETATLTAEWNDEFQNWVGMGEPVNWVGISIAGSGYTLDTPGGEFPFTLSGGSATVSDGLFTYTLAPVDSPVDRLALVSETDNIAGQIGTATNAMAWNLAVATNALAREIEGAGYVKTDDNGLIRSDINVLGYLRAISHFEVGDELEYGTATIWGSLSVNGMNVIDEIAAIREQSLNGIWDETLQVWWTPRMRNGSLTYEATTNVNLNAEN